MYNVIILTWQAFPYSPGKKISEAKECRFPFSNVRDQEEPRDKFVESVPVTTNTIILIEKIKISAIVNA